MRAVQLSSSSFSILNGGPFLPVVRSLAGACWQKIRIVVRRAAPSGRFGRWGRRDLNPHGSPRRILSPFCLPIPALPRTCLLTGAIITLWPRRASSCIIFFRLPGWRRLWPARPPRVRSTMALPVDAPATLLAVDDEPNNLEILTHFLELDGHRVLTAPDGEAALSLVSRDRPHLA